VHSAKFSIFLKNCTMRGLIFVLDTHTVNLYVHCKPLFLCLLHLLQPLPLPVSLLLSSLTLLCDMSTLLVIYRGKEFCIRCPIKILGLYYLSVKLEMCSFSTVMVSELPKKNFFVEEKPSRRSIRTANALALVQS